MTALRELMMWLLLIALTMWVVIGALRIELLQDRVEQLEARK